jgi:hypothetical protein
LELFLCCPSVCIWIDHSMDVVSFW